MLPKMSNPPPVIDYSVPQSGPPGVITWFKVYCVLMALIYLLCAAGGVALLVVDPVEFEMEPTEALVSGILLLVLGLALFVLFLIALFMKLRPWHWTLDLVLICLGLTSCCCWPICIPLLIFWIKPETKAYFA